MPSQTQSGVSIKAPRPDIKYVREEDVKITPGAKDNRGISCLIFAVTFQFVSRHNCIKWKNKEDL